MRKVEQVVECGGVVRDTFTLVFSLVSPANKITLMLRHLLKMRIWQKHCQGMDNWCLP